MDIPKACKLLFQNILSVDGEMLPENTSGILLLAASGVGNENYNK